MSETKLKHQSPQSKLKKKLSKSEADLHFSNLRFIISCLDTQDSSNSDSTEQTIENSLPKRFFLRVKNIAKDQPKKSVFHKFRNSEKPVSTILSPGIARILELPANDKVLNIESINFIQESPIQAKIVADFRHPIAKVSDAYSSCQISQASSNSADNLVHVRIVRKREWQDTFLGIQLSKIETADLATNRFRIVGFSQLGVAKYLSSLELKNMVIDLSC
jgi:hypothetical protein